MERPTDDIYPALQRAYDHFNARLFKGALAPVLITLVRGGRTQGYYHAERFVQAKGDKKVHEICLNPAYFAISSAMCVLSTLVHEMVHQWQHDFGKVSKSSVHNREWAERMLEAGLCASASGLPGGKMTGRRMDHYIINGGAFHVACEELLLQDFSLKWLDRFPALAPRGPLILYPHPDQVSLQLAAERQALVEAGTPAAEIDEKMTEAGKESIEFLRAGDGSLVLAMGIATDNAAEHSHNIRGLDVLARALLTEDGVDEASDTDLAAALVRHGLPDLQGMAAVSGSTLDELRRTLPGPVHAEVVLPPAGVIPKPPRPSRLRYVCSACQAEAWGGPELSISCSSPEHEGKAVLMVAPTLSARVKAVQDAEADAVAP